MDPVKYIGCDVLYSYGGCIVPAKIVGISETTGGVTLAVFRGTELNPVVTRRGVKHSEGKEDGTWHHHEPLAEILRKMELKSDRLVADTDISAPTEYSHGRNPAAYP